MMDTKESFSEFLTENNLERQLISKDYESAIEEILNSFRDKHSPLLLIDIACIYRRLMSWKNTFPTIKPFYAVKCNPDSMIVSFLAECGTGFDCASKSEISLVLENSVGPEQIIFANPYKSMKDLNYAIANGVFKMTFDSVEELHKINKAFIAENALSSLELVLRVKVPNSHSESDLNAKYGCPKNKILSLLREVKKLKINLIGVSFHVGSNCYDASAYKEALYTSKIVFDEAEKLRFRPLKLLDIGGGFPGGHHGGFSKAVEADDTSTNFLTLEEIGEIVNALIVDLFPPDITVIAEPGRFFVEACQTFMATIVDRKILKYEKNKNNKIVETELEEEELEKASMEENKNKDDIEIKYYLNCGVFGVFKDSYLLNCDFFPHVLHEKAGGGPLQNGTLHSKYKSSFYGPTRIDKDCIARKHLTELIPNDSLVYYTSMGAYTSSITSHRMSASKLEVKYVWLE